MTGSNFKQQRENSGIMFCNDRKKTSNHPDYRGALNVDGQEFYINGWIKQGKTGKFLTLAVKAKNQVLKVVGGQDFAF